MKKRIFALAVACVLALSFALVGCGGGSSSSGNAGGSDAPAAPASDTANVAGDWQLYEMANPTNPNSEYIISHDDVVLAAESGYVVSMTLNEDGTGVIDIGGDVTNVTWEPNDADSISINIGGDGTVATIDNGMISIDVGDGDYMVFARA